MPPILQMRKVCKGFGSVVANDNVDLDVEAGEIHALLGENGAGKTTLMNVLYGLYHRDSGEIRFQGRELDLDSPRDAIRAGIGMVHQHFMLAPPLTVTENIILGEKSPGPFLGLRQAEAHIREIAERHHLSVDPRARVWQLSVGEEQRVEIIKALYRGATLLILDEPTSVLTPGEVKALFRILRSLAERGYSVIFISHKLEEVMAISDRVTVLRGGRNVATVPASSTSPRELARMMVGREVLFDVQKERVSRGERVLEVRGVRARSDRKTEALRSVDLEVHASEILGIAGVDGNGQSELAQILTGLRGASGGTIRILGENGANRTPRDLIRMGMAHIPEDRQRVGLILDMTVGENAILQLHGEPPFSRWGFLDREAVLRLAKTLIQQYGVKARGPEAGARTLSGGNQQRLILAREMSRNPRLLIAVHPTRGLDVGATEFVHKQLLARRAAGGAVLLISTELEELFLLSDRIAVLYEGRIMGVFDASEVSRETVGLLMAGSRVEAKA
ncbi:MAG: ABC transporter ATP-binding protein [Candidatus Tectomicrobia bacterium]|nr:ABC transporter ATP-binding protein [Candidatus Tectomicrobia bacterium]